MNRIVATLVLLAALSLAAHAQGQEGEVVSPEELVVELPFAAQQCVLPAAPPKIAEDASYDALVDAKGRVAKFQEDLEAYRKCLDSTRNDQGITQGNLVALTNAHNYSVEMEQRVADGFNEAVRAYNARVKETGGEDK